jgi:hypothetical protein
VRVSSFVLAVVLVACSHSAPPQPRAPEQVASTWKGPAILANVPADTPYLIAVLEPMPPKLREHWYADNVAKVKNALKKAATGEGRMALVAAALYSEIDGADDAHWPEALGFSMDARMVLYGLSIWPVMRLEVKDPTRVREVLGRVVKAGDPDLQPQSVGKAMVYVLKDGKAAYIFGIVEHELVGSVVPSEDVDRALPLILGTQAPAHSLRDAKLIPELLAKHRFLPTMVAYADMSRLFEAVSGHGKGEGDTFAAMLEGKIPAACQDDLSRVAAEFPRLSVGYRHFDEQGFSVTVVLDAPASLLKSLMKLHTPMPAMQIKAQPMLAVSAAVNVDAMLAWMRDVTSQLRSHPFRCDALATVNHDIDELATKLGEPMPPMFQGLRGFELVVDDATMMPPAGTGHLLVAGDHIADVVRQTFAKIPQLASLQLQPNGVALELPLAKLGVPASLKSAFVAMRQTRAAVAIGDSSATRASERVAAPDAHAPLFVVSYDLPKLRERFGMFLSLKKDEDGLEGFNVGTTSFALDVGDDGIDLDVMATWAHGR